MKSYIEFDDWGSTMATEERGGVRGEDRTRYDGKRVVVTGAASGMGAAAAALVAARGAVVVGLDLREVTGVDRALRIDLSAPESIEETVEALSAQAPFDAVFSCAGLAPTAPPLDVMTVNFVGARHLLERLLPSVRDGGAVACVASLASFRWLENRELLAELVATDGFGPARAWVQDHLDVVGDGYSFSKMATVAYTTTRAPQLAARGVRINSVSPGPTDTPMMVDFETAMGADWMQRFPRPTGRSSTPEEQAEVLAFVNSDAASYVTGVNLYSDGGIASAWLTGQVEKPERAR